MKLIMLKGLPASGKSTYALKLAADGYVRVNKDDLRAMLHAGKWSKENEKQVLAMRDSMVSDSLVRGRSVVVDDTNLALKHAIRLKELAKEHGATFETKFFDVPVDECIKRDLKRLNSVGPEVIGRMYKQFLAPKQDIKPVQEFIPGLPTVIIVDLDGTLAHMNGRSPYDESKCDQDTVDFVIRHIVSLYSELGRGIIVCSGRSEDSRKMSESWLSNNVIPFDQLFMRKSGDKRDDATIKQEIFDQKIKGNYNILFVLDDRDRVVKMWRDNGLKCLQVAYGDF